MMAAIALIVSSFRRTRSSECASCVMVRATDQTVLLGIHADRDKHCTYSFSVQCVHAFAQGSLCLLEHWRSGAGGKCVKFCGVDASHTDCRNKRQLVCSVTRQKGSFSTSRRNQDTASKDSQGSDTHGSNVQSETVHAPSVDTTQPVSGPTTEAGGQQHTTSLDGNEALFSDAVYNAA